MRTIADAQLRGWTDLELRCRCGIESVRPLNAFWRFQPDGDLKLISVRLRCHVCSNAPETIQLYRLVRGVNGAKPFKQALLPELDGKSP